MNVEVGPSIDGFAFPGSDSSATPLAGQPPHISRIERNRMTDTTSLTERKVAA
jgi:hypothetical protein